MIERMNANKKNRKSQVSYLRKEVNKAKVCVVNRGNVGLFCEDTNVTQILHVMIS